MGGKLLGTFEKNPAWTHWVKWGRIVSEPAMNSQWTCQVSDPLPPVQLCHYLQEVRQPTHWRMRCRPRRRTGSWTPTKVNFWWSVHVGRWISFLVQQTPKDDCCLYDGSRVYFSVLNWQTSRLDPKHLRGCWHPTPSPSLRVVRQPSSLSGRTSAVT